MNGLRHIRFYDADKTTTALSEYLRVNGQAAVSSEETAALTFNIDRLDLSNVTTSSAVRDGIDAKLFNQTVGFVQARLAALKEQQKIVKTIDQSLEMLQSDNLSREVQGKYQEIVQKNVEQYLHNQQSKTYQNIQLLQDRYQNMNFLLDSEGRTEAYTISPVEVGGFALETTVEVDFGFVWGSSDDQNGVLRITLPGQEPIEIQMDPLQEGGLQKVVEAIQAAGDERFSAKSRVEFEPFDGNAPILAGQTPEAFYINGVPIPQTEIEQGDESGSLRSSINGVQNETDVRAEINDKGSINFVSLTGRSIEIAGDLYTLAGLNILNEDDFPELNINAEALFLEGATLSEYEYTFGGQARVNSIHVNEYDGDDGNYNVYLLDDKTETLIGKELPASGNNVAKSNFMQFETVEADGLVIRPLDEQGREGMSEGLGGWWRINDVDVQWTPDKITYIGKLELSKPSDIRMLGLDEQWGVSEKVEQYRIGDMLYLDLDKENNKDAIRNYLQTVLQDLDAVVSKDQVQLNEMNALYLSQENAKIEVKEEDETDFQSIDWKEFGQLLITSHQNMMNDLYGLLFDDLSYSKTRSEDRLNWKQGKRKSLGVTEA